MRYRKKLGVWGLYFNDVADDVFGCVSVVFVSGFFVSDDDKYFGGIWLGF